VVEGVGHINLPIGKGQYPRRMVELGLVSPHGGRAVGPEGFQGLAITSPNLDPAILGVRDVKIIIGANVDALGTVEFV
jgi:hypothetical protein